MKATATPFIHHALKDTILKIMESKQSCEVQYNRALVEVAVTYGFTIFMCRLLTYSGKHLCLEMEVTLFHFFLLQTIKLFNLDFM